MLPFLQGLAPDGSSVTGVPECSITAGSQRCILGLYHLGIYMAPAFSASRLSKRCLSGQLACMTNPHVHRKSLCTSMGLLGPMNEVEIRLLIGSHPAHTQAHTALHRLLGWILLCCISALIFSEPAQILCFQTFNCPVVVCVDITLA